jgi:hypothetical protein
VGLGCKEAVDDSINGGVANRVGPLRNREDNNTNYCTTKNGQLVGLVEQALAGLGEPFSFPWISYLSPSL